GDVRTALRRELAARIVADSIEWEPVQDLMIEAFRAHTPESLDAAISKIRPLCGRDASGVPREGGLIGLIRHRPVALMLVADRIAALIEEGRPQPVTALDCPRELVHEIARLVADNTAAIRHLTGWIKRNAVVQPLAASLLHAASPGWRPDPDCRPRLEGASLDGIVWPGQNLEGINLRGATMRGADLS